MNTLHKNDIIRLRIEALAFGGQGVAHTDEGFTVFVRNALPEQEVDVKIVKKRKNYAEATINRVVSASRFQVEPRCSYYGACGGCLLQHHDYAEQ
ncbi:MAG: TRAM domain-containing protein, partial [bacterium]|nr:TRAM domain-containing protein [bacterium]